MKHVIVAAALLGGSAQAAGFLGKPITDTTAPLCGRAQCKLLSSRVEYREFGTVRIRTFQMRGTDVKLTYTSDSTGVIREGTLTVSRTPPSERDVNLMGRFITAGLGSTYRRELIDRCFDKLSAPRAPDLDDDELIALDGHHGASCQLTPDGHMKQSTVRISFWD